MNLARPNITLRHSLSTSAQEPHPLAISSSMPLGLQVEGRSLTLLELLKERAEAGVRVRIMVGTPKRFHRVAPIDCGSLGFGGKVFSEIPAALPNDSKGALQGLEIQNGSTML